MANENARDICEAMLRKQEKRNKRMQIVVKPSTFNSLEKLKADGVIKSKNDLINNFLEEFIRRSERGKK